jgi:hypothetical protein
MHSHCAHRLNRREFGWTLGLGLLMKSLGTALRAEEPRSDRSGKKGRTLNKSEERFLRELQERLLRYFVDNQVKKNGFVFDRQRNHGAPRENGITSSSATGMGMIAIALASAKEYGLISAREAEDRIIKALEHALKVPEVGGMIAHFFGDDEKPVATYDAIATIDSSWLIAGALWSAAFFRSAKITALAKALHDRVNWRQWTDAADAVRPDLLRHGMANDGNPLLARWDRLIPESAFMYLIATGACGTKNVSRAVWKQLSPHWGQLQGHRLASSDLGLFALRWSLLLFDFSPYYFTDGLNLVHEGDLAAELNYFTCQALKDVYKTFQTFWGLSAGDGPPENETEEEKYREYAPGSTDGTANILATVTALECLTDEVLANLDAAKHHGKIMGRYGPSSVNFAQRNRFISPYAIGTDVAAAILAIDNVLYGGRPRRIFEEVPCIIAAREGMREYRRAA